MKVLHVVEPFSSGIVTFIIQLTEQLPSEEHIIFHGTRVSQDKVQSVRDRFPQYVKFKIWKSAGREINLINDLKAFFELREAIKKERPDVIHLHSSKAGFIGRLYGLFANVKIIYTPNGAAFLRTDVGVFKRKFYRWLEYFANKFSGKVVCCSKSEKQEFIKIGVDCTYINNGIEPYEIKKIKSDKIIIANFALISYQKNPELFSEIAENFVKATDIEFWWVGDGDRSKIASNNVKILGWQDKSEVKELFRHIDIYLSSSRWEGLPFSVLEAMNASCCLVLSNCVGHKDLVKEGSNGFLFNEKAMAIRYLDEMINNINKIKNMGEESRRLLKVNFSAKKCANKYFEVYKT